MIWHRLIVAETTLKTRIVALGVAGSLCEARIPAADQWPLNQLEQLVEQRILAAETGADLPDF